MKYLNTSQRTVLYFLLWFGLITFGFVQRSRIAKLQDQVDQVRGKEERKRENKCSMSLPSFLLLFFFFLFFFVVIFIFIFDFFPPFFRILSS